MDVSKLKQNIKQLCIKKIIFIPCFPVQQNLRQISRI